MEVIAIYPAQPDLYLLMNSDKSLLSAEAVYFWGLCKDSRLVPYIRNNYRLIPIFDVVDYRLVLSLAQLQNFCKCNNRYCALGPINTAFSHITPQGLIKDGYPPNDQDGSE